MTLNEVPKVDVSQLQYDLGDPLTKFWLPPDTPPQGGNPFCWQQYLGDPIPVIVPN